MTLETQETPLYDLIGPALVERAVTEFYRRAFQDPMIGHFFFHSNIEHITAQQIDFATALLGGPQRYRGKPLKMAHKPFTIRVPHFMRRQVLMREVLTDVGVTESLRAQWLALEESFRPVILTDADHCKT